MGRNSLRYGGVRFETRVSSKETGDSALTGTDTDDETCIGLPEYFAKPGSAVLCCRRFATAQCVANRRRLQQSAATSGSATGARPATTLTSGALGSGGHVYLMLQSAAERACSRIPQEWHTRSPRDSYALIKIRSRPVIETLATLIPEELMDKSGSVFYSGRDAFSGSKLVYLLGLNPGGDPLHQAHETVRWHVEKVLHKTPANWSEYRDEQWLEKKIGQGKMQRRVRYLCQKLGSDPGEVPASNIVFSRSRREDTFGGHLGTIAKLCWPFHQAVIDALKVRTLICFGGTAGAWVRGQLRANAPLDEFVERNRRKWKSRAFIGLGGIAVIVVAHPSVAKWMVPEADPTEFIRKVVYR